MKTKLKNLQVIAARTALAVGVAGASMLAHAQEAPTIASLTSQISFADVLVGVFAIGALLAALYASMKGVRLILGMIRGR